MMQQSPGSPHRRIRRLIAALLSICVLLVGVGAAVKVVPLAHAAVTPGHGASSCAQPPAGKDPSTFTDAQLMAYGLPPRLPKQAQSVWEGIARHVKKHVCVPLPKPNAHSKPAYADCTFCWAGYQAQDANNFFFTTAQWQVPCLQQAGEYQDSIAGEWVGIGGQNDGSLVQTGVGESPISFVHQGIPITITVAWAWVENVGAYMNDAPITVFPVSCGDEMGAVVMAPNYMYIVDETSGTSASENFGPSADTTEAECMVENPNNGAQHFANFGTATFSSCYADDDVGTSGGLQNFTHQADTMWNLDQSTIFGIPIISTVTMAAPGPISGNGQFSTYWYAAN
jgi:hypothetical protein